MSLPASPTTLGAIVAVFDASAAGTITGGDTAKSGGLWFGQIPEQISDKALPFVRFIHEGDVAHYTTEPGYFETTSFKFEAYHQGLAATELVASHIKAAFDCPLPGSAQAKFAIANALAWQCWRPDGRVGYQVAEVGERESTGEKVFCATLSYEMQVSKSL